MDKINTEDMVDNIIPMKKPRGKKISPKESKSKKEPVDRRVVLKNSSVKMVTKTLTGSFGECECINFIPYEEKVSLAINIVERSIIFDDESGRGYNTTTKSMETILGLIEAYTNIHIPKDDRYDFYAYLISTDLIDLVKEIIYPDAKIVEEIASVIRESAIDRFNHEHGIEHYFNELSSGSQAGNDLLNLINVASENQNKVAVNITDKIEEMQQISKGSMIDFSKRKK